MLHIVIGFNHMYININIFIYTDVQHLMPYMYLLCQMSYSPEKYVCGKLLFKLFIHCMASFKINKPPK